MDKKDSFFCNPQLGQSSTPRSYSPPLKKPRLEDLFGMKKPWGEKSVAMPNHAKISAHVLDLLAQAAKHGPKVFKRRRPPMHKVMETANTTTTSASKQSQPNVTDPSDVVADGVGVPEENSQENCRQEQCEWSVKRTRTSSASEDLSPNLPHMQVKFETSKMDDGLVEFWGLARLPRCHASLLKKECICHPNLIICSGRTPRWRQFAYETLGELLFFLRSTRVGEMTVEKRAHLQGLWEEAQGLGFDLSWLEPGVRFGLDSCSYLELQRETVATLEEEKRRLDEGRETLQCQLSTLTMLMCENERGRAALELLIQRAKDNVKSAEATFLC